MLSFPSNYNTCKHYQLWPCSQWAFVVPSILNVLHISSMADPMSLLLFFYYSTDNNYSFMHEWQLYTETNLPVATPLKRIAVPPLAPVNFLKPFNETEECLHEPLLHSRLHRGRSVFQLILCRILQLLWVHDCKFVSYPGSCSQYSYQMCAVHFFFSNSSSVMLPEHLKTWHSCFKAWPLHIH